MGRDRSSSAITADQLAGAQDRFIAAWGQMGPMWGISRTIAEVHALLYIVGAPLNTDDVMERLHISRGNASMSLRSLLDWGIVARVHKRGDRKEYFVAEQDVWALARTVMRERLRREILPTLATLHEIRDATASPPPPSTTATTADPVIAKINASPGSGPALPEQVREHNARLDALVELLRTIDRLGERFVGSEGKGLKIAATLLSKMV